MNTASLRLQRPFTQALRHTVVSCGVAFTAASLAFQAAAQSPGAAPVAAEGPAPAGSAAVAGAATQQLEAVTITATRRREPAREVPMQVNSLSTEQLERAGARSLSDYMSRQAGVDVKGGASGLGALNVRGVSTGDQTIATVGIYIDDVAFGSSSAYALGSATALDMTLLDLNHIELLRGPQGTLYGAGSMGGLLKYVTNEPDTSEFSGKVALSGSISQGGSAGHGISTVLNLPLKQDVAGLRLAAFRDHVGGYIDASGPAAGKDINRGDTTGARLSLLLEPSRASRIRLSAMAQDIQHDSVDTFDLNPVTGQAVDGDLTHQIAQREPYSVKLGLVAAELEYELGWASFKSITAAQRLKVAQHIDYSAVYAPLLSGAGLVLDRVIFDGAIEVHKRTQEFRLTSPKGTVEWLGGFYYDHQSGENGQIINSRQAADATPGPLLANVTLPSSYTETALYGDLTWNATPAWSFTGGLRTAVNRQRFRQASEGLLLAGCPGAESQSQDSSRTWLATARHALTPTSNAYVRVASGYRPGGPNAVVCDPVSGGSVLPPSFEPDHLWSYELGYKADLPDKALSLEAAIYRILWSDMQQTYAVSGMNAIVNAGKVRIDGAELTLRYRPSGRWTLDGNLAYLDSELTEDAPGLGSAGARLPNSAWLSASLGLQHQFELGGHASYAGFTLRHVGERNAGFDGSGTLPNYKIPAYDLIDLQAGIDWGRWQLALFVRNLADKRAQLSASSNLMTLGGPVQVTPAQPRTLGTTLTATF